MPPIYFETASNEVYQIDEKAQRLLVYTHLHGEISLADAVDPVGAETTTYLQARAENQLGELGAGLLQMRESQQMRLDGEYTSILFVSLTDKGERFLRDHRAELSMPVEIAELSKRVAELQLEDDAIAARLEEEDVLDRLADQLVERIEERLTDSIK